MFTPCIRSAILAVATALAAVLPAAAQCPPSRPTGFSATDGTQCNGVSINWSDVSGATNYELWRSRNSNMSSDTVIGNPVNSQFLDITALPGITYYYRVRTFRALCLPGDNFSDFSSINAGHRGDSPPTPGNVSASNGTLCTGVAISWTISGGSPTYDVLRSTQNDPGTSIPLNPAPLVAESFTDLTALPDHTYYYWVRALSLCGSSMSASNSGFRGTAPTLPNPHATKNTRCDGILVSWNAVAATPPVTGYRILRGTTDTFEQAAQIQSLAGSVTSYLDTSTAAGDEYRYWVISSNNCGIGVGQPASTVGVRALSVSITRQPVGQTVVSGEVAWFEADAEGTGLSYQWQWNGDPIPGATSRRLAIVPAHPSDAGTYRVIVTGSCGSVTSSNAELVVGTRPGDCSSPPSDTFTVTFPKLGLPPDEEGQGWLRPAVWAGHPGATDDSIEVPNGRPIYALFVSGYAQNAYLDQLIFYDFARRLMADGAYVHFAWWNNLLAPYMERPLHHTQSHPGTTQDFANFGTPQQAADKAVPGEDYQFVADARRLLKAIRENNPGAIIIIAGHSMGGGAVVHLAAQADVVIDIAAPIDPVGNRNYPWAGASAAASHFNWTRWRVTRDNFLGYRFRDPLDVCEPADGWLADYNDADSICPAGPEIHAAPALQFGRHIINLFHRWQHESVFPFDYSETYTFGYTPPMGGTTSQLAVTTRSAGTEEGGWPLVNLGGACCPSGPGVCWPTDGHGEIVGFRGPGQTQPLGVRVRTAADCGGCSTAVWPARTLDDGVWSDEDSGARRQHLRDLEVRPHYLSWSHEPFSPGLCLVSQDLIDLYNSMNQPPVSRAGPDQTVVCNGCPSAGVTLDGSASTDPDQDVLAFTWVWSFGTAPGPVVNIDLPVGTHCITLEVQDPSGHIARDTVAVTVDDPAAHIVPYTSSATVWKGAAGEYRAVAFDEFLPGAPGATRCLLPSQSTPAVLSLDGGTLTVSALNAGTPTCAITDSATAPAVSDAQILTAQSSVTFAFEPPVTAFYTYYGSLGAGHTATMALYDDAGAYLTSITTPQSTHSSLAAGQGFTSLAPVSRIEFTTTEPGAVLIGAFVGLRSGEQSLGTVNLGNYNGPNGSGIIEFDFACTFAGCAADFNSDGGVDGSDVDAFFAAWEVGDGTADFNRDGGVDGSDVGAFFARWEGGC